MKLISRDMSLKCRRVKTFFVVCTLATARSVTSSQIGLIRYLGCWPSWIFNEKKVTDHYQIKKSVVFLQLMSGVVGVLSSVHYTFLVHEKLFAMVANYAPHITKKK